MHDNLSVSVDFENVDASLVCKSLIFFTPGLHMGGSSYEVKLLCKIDATSDEYICRLTPKQGPVPIDAEGLREYFLDLVTDENLREKVSAETSGVRDVILALAFGALAAQREDTGPA